MSEYNMGISVTTEPSVNGTGAQDHLHLRKAPVIKRRMVIPKLDDSIEDTLLGLELLAEQFTTRRVRQEEQLAAAAKEREEEFESLRGYAEWMAKFRLKYMLGVQTALGRLDPRDHESYLASELPNRKGVTVQQQLDEFRSEINVAKEGDDPLIPAFLEVEESVFWISAGVSQEKLAKELDSLVQRELLHEHRKGKIEDCEGRRFRLNKKRFGNADQRTRTYLEERLWTAVGNEVTRLRKENIQEERKTVTEMVSPENQDVSLEELFFGDPAQFQTKEGKRATIAWKYRNTDNVIVLVRYWDDLYIEKVVGTVIRKALDRMVEEMPENLGRDGPFIPLEYLLAKNDPQHFCGIKTVNERSQFDYGMYLEPFAFQMTFWIRMGIGNCDSLPTSRFLGDPVPKSNSEGGNYFNGSKKQPMPPVCDQTQAILARIKEDLGEGEDTIPAQEWCAEVRPEGAAVLVVQNWSDGTNRFDILAARVSREYVDTRSFVSLVATLEKDRGFFFGIAGERYEEKEQFEGVEEPFGKFLRAAQKKNKSLVNQ